MEFVNGETLATRLKRASLTEAEVQRLADDLLGALSAAHAIGVIHRDVKPANVFLRDSRALLGDFGIARWRTYGDSGNTIPGQLLGTVHYMAPEQLEGHTATERTDVYAAGLVLWEAGTGKRWSSEQAPEGADWNALPPPLRLALPRALAAAPCDFAGHWPSRWDANWICLPRKHGPTIWIMTRSECLSCR